MQAILIAQDFFSGAQFRLGQPGNPDQFLNAASVWSQTRDKQPIRRSCWPLCSLALSIYCVLVL